MTSPGSPILKAIEPNESGRCCPNHHGTSLYRQETLPGFHYTVRSIIKISITHVDPVSLN